MTAALSAQCLLCRAVARHCREAGIKSPSRTRVITSQRSRSSDQSRRFSSTPSSPLRKNNNATPLAKTASPALATTSPSRLKPYRSSDRALLAKRYTPAQLHALDLAESSISADDLIEQGSIRNGHMSIRYLDDFSTVRPVIDYPIRNPKSTYTPDHTLREESEHDEDLGDFFESLPDDISEDEIGVRWLKFQDELRMTNGPEAAERQARSYLSTPLPNMSDPNMVYTKADESEVPLEIRRRLAKKGIAVEDYSKLFVKTLMGKSVTNQTRMGKIRSMYYLCVAGDGKGMVGIGEGKSAEAEDARRIAAQNAVGDMSMIERYENRTVYGEVQEKVGAASVRLRAASPGYGLRCQSYIFELCRAAGISDISGRVIRSRNPMNVVKATLAALRNQRMPGKFNSTPILRSPERVTNI